MRVAELGLETSLSLKNKEVTSLTQQSDQAGPGSLFFAIEGTSRDGHEYIEDLLRKSDGPVAVVVRKGHPKTVAAPDHFRARLIEVADTRRALGLAASAFYGNPSHSLIVCGVTGTNGKTTSTYLLEAVLNASGNQTGVIGTIENRLGGYKVPPTHTTPDALHLQALLRDFANRGATAAAIEVTSHALEQYRAYGTRFRAVLFTNLSQDHLDYHCTLENYFAAKAKLFLEYPTQIRVIHAEDSYGKRLLEMCRERKLEVTTYGRANCDINYEKLRFTHAGVEGDLIVRGRPFPVQSPLVGAFNGQNIAGVVAVAEALGITHDKWAAAIAHVRVPGRMETVPNKKKFAVVVDYSHTPDALEKALSTLRPLCRGRLLCVFGCGGDRDATKRPIMGGIAEKLADEIFVTSDNPRTENPERIIDAIFRGLESPASANRISNRREAIAQAIGRLKPGDILLIAGKGHEDYQIIGTQKLPFDDRSVALENLT